MDSCVHRRGLLRSVLIDWGLLGDERIDIGDADHNFHVAIGGAFGDFDLVEIARSVVVDGRPE
jgi:hypothetical protein